MSRIDSSYQWYRADGRWSFEAVKSARRVAPRRTACSCPWGRRRSASGSPAPIRSCASASRGSSPGSGRPC
ncbi:hypothetical protein, partial [Methylobacterium sp. B1]|uniref:hypothetical protein n=1 Tax=Methylobacterium sp. B1 TaxID=91459 RepID=UPI0035B506B6